MFAREGPSLLPLYLSVFVAVLGFSLIVPIFPFYVLDLGASYTLLGVIISVYGAVQLLAQVPAGRLSDRMGRKPLLLLGLATFGIMPPLYLYATNAYLLVPIRVLGGVGASVVWPTAMALLIDQVSPRERGRAMGWFNATFYSALAVGPLIGGALYDLFGLAAPFYFWSLLAALSFLVVLSVVKEPLRQGWPKKASTSTPVEGLVMPGFSPTFLACCSVVLLAGIIGGFNITLLPAYAGSLGLSITEIGLLYMAFAGSSAVSNVYFGRQADRGSRKMLMFGGCVIVAVSFLALTSFEKSYIFFILLGALGLGSGMGNPAAAALIADITTPSRRGEIFGIFNTARMAGVVIGPIIAGMAADAYGVVTAIFAFLAIALAVAFSTMVVRETPPVFAVTESDINP